MFKVETALTKEDRAIYQRIIDTMARPEYETHKGSMWSQDSGGLMITNPNYRHAYAAKCRIAKAYETGRAEEPGGWLSFAPEVY